MAASSAPVEPADDAYAPEPARPSLADGDAGHAHRLLRLPGGEPMPRRAPARAVSVRRTVGMRERSAGAATSGGGWLVRAGIWGTAASVLMVGSLLIHQLLFTPEGQIQDWFTAPFSASLSTDPDLPPKSALISSPLGPKAVVPSGAVTDDFPSAAREPDSSGPGSGTDDSAGPGPGSGSGSDDTSGSDSGDGSGSGSGSTPGSGDNSGSGSGDSSGHGSGGDSGDSSGHGSGGGSGDDSSGHGSGTDGPARRA